MFPSLDKLLEVYLLRQINRSPLGCLLPACQVRYNGLMDSTEAQAQQEIAQVVLVVEELTGLPSRWSGRVELVPDAEFRGKKLFSCSILLDTAVAQHPVRWRTLIHEALHSVSAGYTRADYDTLIG